MNSELRAAFEIEMAKARIEYFNENYLASFSYLERAHILGQSFIIPHTLSHWWMLKTGLRTNNFQEVFGQLLRIIASILFSRVWVPIGNTGGTNVNPFKSMPIPEDLEKYLKQKT